MIFIEKHKVAVRDQTSLKMYSSGFSVHPISILGKTSAHSLNNFVDEYSVMTNDSLKSGKNLSIQRCGLTKNMT